jgi:phage baseplate assembly protein W
MARILTPKKVNDLKPNQGIGINLPFTGEGVFNVNYLTKDQVKANLINLFMTDRGERLHNPNFGVGLRQLLFQNEISEDEVKSLIETQVGLYVDNVTIEQINLDFNYDQHSLNIQFVYSLTYEESPQQLEITIEL